MRMNSAATVDARHFRGWLTSLLAVASLGVVGMCTSVATAQPSEIATLLDKIRALEQLVATQHAAMQTQIATLQRSQQALEAPHVRLAHLSYGCCRSCLSLLPRST